MFLILVISWAIIAPTCIFLDAGGKWNAPVLQGEIAGSQTGQPPTSNQPPDLHLLVNSTNNTITWIITDPDDGFGLYYIFEGTQQPDLASINFDNWLNATPINYQVDTSTAGTFQYNMLFTDMTITELLLAYSSNSSISGNISVVMVYIEAPPQIQAPDLVTYHVNDTGNILFTITDADSNNGTYNVSINGTAYASGLNWTNGTVNTIPVNTTTEGTFEYTITYSDGNYTYNHTTTAWIAQEFPPIPVILSLNSPVISAANGLIYVLYMIYDLEDSNGSYWILENNTLIDNGTWLNQTSREFIHIRTQMGLYIYEIWANDSNGNNYSTTFQVYVNSPPNCTIPENRTVPVFTNVTLGWVITDLDDQNGTYTIYRNSTPIISGTWNDGDNITVDVRTDFAATRVFTIEYSDGYTTRTQTTVVTVVDTNGLKLEEPTKFWITAIFVLIGFGGVIGILKGKK